MATRSMTQPRGTYDEATKAVRTPAVAGDPNEDVSVIGSGHGSASGVAGEATTGRDKGAGIGATFGTLVGAGAGLMAGIGALPIPGAGPVVAAGWLVAVLTGAGVGAGIGAAAGRLLGSLTSAGGDEGNAHAHAQAAPHRGTALPPRVEEAEAARFESVLADGGGHVDVAVRRAEPRAEGRNGLEPATAARTASGVQAERKRRVSVYDASAAADAVVHRGAEALQQAGSSADDAPREGTGVIADAACQGSEARTETVRFVSVHDARAAADAAVRRTAEAMQQSGCPADDTPCQDTEVAADASRRGVEAGAEGVRRDMQAVVESQRRIAQDLAEPVGAVSREAAEAARATTEEARRMAAPPDAAEGGPRDLQQGVAGPFESAVQTNLRMAQELFRLANPVPVVELQQRFAREYTDTMMRNSATLVRAMRRTADETLRPLEEQVRQREQDGQRFQNAAE